LIIIGFKNRVKLGGDHLSLRAGKPRHYTARFELHLPAEVRPELCSQLTCSINRATPRR
jgi:hypothetical protein